MSEFLNHSVSKSSAKEKLNVALVGFPNSGKTTLYNWLTGSKFKTVNYPGSTVEYSSGTLISKFAASAHHEIQLVDTPGIYSFDPQSADEEVTLNVILNRSTEHSLNINLVLIVIDATQLGRQLFLVQKLIKAKIPFKVVLTMADLLLKNKINFNLKKLKEHLETDVLLFDGTLGQGLTEIVQAVDTDHSNTKTIDSLGFEKWTEDLHSEARQWSKKIVNDVAPDSKANLTLESTLKLDKYLLHPIFGYIFFFVIMTFLFTSIYFLAAPFMDLIEKAFGFLGDFLKNNVPGLFGEFLSEGIIAAISGVAIFVPQIFILFIFIYTLEASGYLARVAALIDRPLSAIGLGGRSFVPMLSGFACAIPAIIATRNISSKKEKIIAQSLIPLLTCSARIPVYSLMISFLFKDASYLSAGFVMAALYLSSIIVAAVASAVLSRLIDSKQKSKLMMDLPLYRAPKIKIVILYGLARAKSFLKKAGPIIFVLSIIIWFATNFPRNSEMSAQQIAQNSYAAQVGKIIEPVFIPMGLDWRAGFGIISAFAAREVFVSSLALIFNAEGEDDQQQLSLLDKMHQAKFPDGRPIFTVASSLGILVFFMIALQCLATFAILRRETGSLKIATAQLVTSNLVAYALAVSINYLFRFI